MTDTTSLRSRGEAMLERYMPRRDAPEEPSFTDQLQTMVKRGDVLRADNMALADRVRELEEQIREVDLEHRRLILDKNAEIGILKGERDHYQTELHVVTASRNAWMTLATEAETRFSAGIEIMTAGRERARHAMRMAGVEKPDDSKSDDDAAARQEEKQIADWANNPENDHRERPPVRPPLVSYPPPQK